VKSAPAARKSTTHPSLRNKYEGYDQEHNSCQKRRRLGLRNIDDALRKNTRQNRHNPIQRRHSPEDITQRSTRLSEVLPMVLSHHPALEDAVHQRRRHAAEDAAEEDDEDV
jgi:hypothetical protein